MPRQYLQDFVARASQWFHFDAPEVPQEVIPWVLAVDYFEKEIHTKYAAYETSLNESNRVTTDTVLFFRRPQAHEISQDIHDYSRIITARVRTFNLPTKHLLESILAELPDPAEFKAYIDKLIDGGEDSDGSSIHSISEVSDSSYVSSDEVSSDDEKLLEDFI